MGKGRVITDHGEGRYTIELLEDRVRAETSRALAVQHVAALDTRITELETDLSAAQADVDSAADAQDQAIAAYQAEVTDGDNEPTADLKQAMIDASKALIEAAAKRDAIARNIGSLKTERLALQRRIDLIDALPALRQQEAWCADYTEELAGEVATAEVPGEATQVLVRPGYNGEAVYDTARDGALQPALSGTPASVFYNLAMMPGWQKWRPTYRIATITTLSENSDTCDIDIAPATSSEQGLNVNAESSYATVPIEYMTCNSAAFEVGDRVLVRFDPTDQSPTVIGFESNPRPCGIDTIVAVPVILHFKDQQGFLISSPCACGFTTLGPGPYTEYAVEDYAWDFIFADMPVFSAGNLAAALSAAVAADFPTEDEVASTNVERNSPKFSPTLYPHEFPTSVSGTCGTQTTQWSHVAVTRGMTLDGTPDTFFGGEVEVDPQYHQPITLEDQVFQVSYTPAIIRRDWESLESGVYTTATSGTDCTAGLLNSKEIDPEGTSESVFSVLLGSMPNITTADGYVRQAKGIFHVVPDDPVYSSDSKNVTFPDGSNQIFGNRLSNVAYLMVGYGR